MEDRSIAGGELAALDVSAAHESAACSTAERSTAERSTAERSTAERSTAELEDGEGGIQITHAELGGIPLVVIAASRTETPIALSPAERSVVELLLEGCSNHEIAARRQSSVKTVANQLRLIYRKLGVSSRFELAALLSR